MSKMKEKFYKEMNLITQDMKDDILRVEIENAHLRAASKEQRALNGRLRKELRKLEQVILERTEEGVDSH